VGSENNANELFFNLLVVCEQNDFLHRISLGNVFANLSNPAQFQNYVRIARKNVYLDTQILIYTLCTWYEKVDDFENVYYRTVRELIDFSDRHSNVKLYTTTLYVAETAYHLKEALLLIPFEEVDFLQKFKASNNVLYKFYKHLKDTQKLDDNIDNFENFLGEFDLFYDDIYDKKFIQIASELIIKYLESLNIEIIEIPKVDKDPAFEIFKNSLTISGKLRPEITIGNDAILMTYLSSRANHEFEPIFTTWDTAFYEARKRYFAKFRGSNSWHLFSPAKLLNHLSLLEFEVNAQSLTNDFLSILYSPENTSKADNFLDAMSNLFDIGKEEKRRYLVRLKQFSNEYVLEVNKVDTGVEHEKEETQPIEILINRLTYHYKNWNNPYNLDDLKAVFDNSDYFDRIMNVFKRELENLSNNLEVSKNLFTDIDEVIQENIARKKGLTSSPLNISGK
jgi:hypothetical protein